MFFSYGHIYSLIKGLQFGNFTIGRHRYLGILCIFIIAILIIYLHKNEKHNYLIFNYFYITLFVFVIYSLVSITSFSIKKSQSQKISRPNIIHVDKKIDNSTDIYFIILDGYSRYDYLQEIANFDNSEFLYKLEDIGFFVSQCSRSNYDGTILSLSSSLNLGYVQDLVDFQSIENKIEMDLKLKNLILNNRVINILKTKGYKTISFQTGFSFSEIRDADIFIDINNVTFSWNSPISKFEVIIIKNSAITFLQSIIPQFNDYITPALNQIYRNHRDSVQNVINNLLQIPPIEGPKFVFAHIISPHPPFVFGENGEFIGNNTSFFTGYEPQIKYLNSQVIEIINKILASSEYPPVIIVQSDHGGPRPYMGTNGRLANLSAIYFPGRIPNSMTQFHTPVNNFRVIFNEIFNESLPILENKSFALLYENTSSSPPPFELLPNELDECTIPIR